MRYISLETASSVFTTNTSGHKRILMVESILDSCSSSALMCGQGFLVNGRPAYFATSAYRQPLPRLPLRDLQKLLEDVPLAVRSRMWYTHDGALAQFSHAVRGVLSNTYHDRWIGRGGPTAWPPCSTSDLNPLNFYLWGHLKTPVDNEETLHHRIVDACQTVCNYPSIFEWMRWSMMRHVEAFIESQGHFDHSL
jgi:hypothetical protein